MTALITTPTDAAVQRAARALELIGWQLMAAQIGGDCQRIEVVRLCDHRRVILDINHGRASITTEYAIDETYTYRGMPHWRRRYELLSRDRLHASTLPSALRQLAHRLIENRPSLTALDGRNALRPLLVQGG